MVRVRIPGGRITARQYLACDELSRTVGNETLRITTRQEFQLHGILKQDLKATIRTVNETLLDTLAACGDVERNILCCPAPIHDEVRAKMQEDCAALAAHLAPRSSSYWDIWLDGEKIENPDAPKPEPALVPTPGDDAVEPIYGKTYMPRKFKTAFALPGDNCTDVYANDLGYVAVVEGGELVGYNVIVGGGMGTTPSAAKTFPAVAVAAGLRVEVGGAPDRRGRGQGPARLRQPIRPQAGPAEVRDLRLGDRRLQGQGRGVPRRTPHAVARPARDGGRRPPRLARAGGRPTGSSASRSRTVGSRTKGRSGWRAACGPTSRSTARRPG